MIQYPSTMLKRGNASIYISCESIYLSVHPGITPLNGQNQWTYELLQLIRESVTKTTVTASMLVAAGEYNIMIRTEFFYGT